MKNMLYFAVSGKKDFSVPENSGIVFGGFGFHRDGTLRFPCLPDENAVILFDDRIIPEQPTSDGLISFCREHRVRSVIFDFEKKPNAWSAPLSENSLLSEYVRILVPPYHPKVAFSEYLQTVRKRCQKPVIDLKPINCTLNCGIWKEETALPCDIIGCYSEKHCCMYCIEKNGSSVSIRYYDTKKTVRKRAEKSGLPCLLPLSEYEKLSD